MGEATRHSMKLPGCAGRFRRPGSEHAWRQVSRGQSLVEFAIVLPVFILVVVGVMDFGFMLYARMTVINAARQGAQYGSSLPATDWPSMATLVPTQANDVATGLSGTLTVTVTCLAPTSLASPPIKWNATCSWTDSTLQSGSDAVQVTVAYKYKTFFPLFFGASINLSSTDQMVIYAPPAT